jgi:hypothetical protein
MILIEYSENESMGAFIQAILTLKHIEYCNTIYKTHKTSFLTTILSSNS